MTNEPNNNPEPQERPLSEDEIGFAVSEDVQEPSGKSTKGTAGRKARRIILIVLGVILGILLLLAAAFAILWATGRSSLLGYQVNVSLPSELTESALEDGSRVQYQGQSYVYNKNAVNVLFMGIDKADIAVNEGYGANGQADCLLVLNFDTVTGAIKILPISREVMTDVNVYTADGNFAGVERMQLCLAYAYGATGKESCENVRQSVSRLLYGVQIGSYIAIDLDGVRALTDVVGGVRLTPNETLNSSSGTIYEGQETVLKGKLVDIYLRSRGSDVEANNRRMQRQKQFITAFASQAGNQVLSDFGKLARFYNTAVPYTVTDVTLSELTYLASCCLTADVGNSIVYNSISGEMVMGEKYVEFHADSQSVFEAVLDTFYTIEN